MKVINNPQEYEAFYHHKEKPTEYPAGYPCVAVNVTYGFGTMGEQTVPAIYYIPNDVDQDSWVKGFMRGYKAGEDNSN
jgi:hypothetical protein